jgi:cell filamentation protein
VSDRDPYLYPGSSVLRNKPGLTDPAQFEAVERALVTQRISEGIPAGEFDLVHLQAIHHHLFQDVFDWAGAVRTVEIAKGGHQFQFRRFIETGMRDVHRRLAAGHFLCGLSRPAFAAAAGEIIGDVNYVHPFREGNGRCQLLYLEQLAERAGHGIDLLKLDPRAWIAASRAAHAGDYAPMSAQIRLALVVRRDS